MPGAAVWTVAVWSAPHSCWGSIAVCRRKITAYRLYERLRLCLPCHVRVVEVVGGDDDAVVAALTALPVPSVSDDLFAFDGVYDRFIDLS